MRIQDILTSCDFRVIDQKIVKGDTFTFEMYLDPLDSSRALLYCIYYSDKWQCFRNKADADLAWKFIKKFGGTL